MRCFLISVFLAGIICAFTPVARCGEIADSSVLDRVASLKIGHWVASANGGPPAPPNTFFTVARIDNPATIGAIISELKKAEPPKNMREIDMPVLPVLFYDKEENVLFGLALIVGSNPAYAFQGMPVEYSQEFRRVIETKLKVGDHIGVWLCPELGKQVFPLVSKDFW